LTGTYGIGHTRWATHGRPTEENAHPHRDCTGRVVVVHNGIIEKLPPAQRSACAPATTFRHRDGHGVVAHLVEEYMRDGGALERRAPRDVRDLRGIFALSIISVTSRHDRRRPAGAARRHRPRRRRVLRRLRRPPILQHTRDVFFLGDGEIAVLTRDAVRVTDFEGDIREPQQPAHHVGPDHGREGRVQTFMLKEIYEQPAAVRDTVQGRLSLRHRPRLPRPDGHHGASSKGSTV
jgi:glucosamine--fructose-6-phosphate aminotransferase (isomerizing)